MSATLRWLHCLHFTVTYSYRNVAGHPSGNQGRFQGEEAEGAVPSEIYDPLCPPPKKFKIRQSLAKIFSISCHFNAFMFCDILMIYITY